MKEFKLGKWIIRFLIITFMLLTYDSIINKLNELIETAKENKAQINENIDANAFLTMKDLGFEYHDTIKSKLDTIDIRIDPNGFIYELTIDNNDVNNYLWLNFSFYQFSTLEIANEAFEELTKSIYQNELNGIECRLGTCVIPNIDYESVIKYLNALDLNKWNVDRGFATNELFVDGMNYLILQKENQIMILFYSDGNLLNESHIPTIVNLFNKTNEIFK